MIHDKDKKPDDELIGIAEDKPEHSARELALADEVAQLRGQLEKAKRAQKVPKGLTQAKQLLKPLFDALKLLFEDVEDPAAAATSPAWEPWRQRAGGGARRKMLDVVIERGAVNRAQLATLATVSIRSSTFRNSLSWMRSNRLVTVEGDTIRRAEL